MSRRKSGKKVSQSNTIETKVATILESMNVPFEQQVAIDKYTVDFLVDKKYIVECYGDFWHCNPHQYTSSYFNRGKKKTAEEIWERDNQRKEQFQKMGYKFLCLWESDIRNNVKIIRSKIKKNIRLDNQ
jgi:G:T-mismatch repair DNA endonuclease (very short patch repair protein)